jgi:hypothetical protein
MPDFEVKIQSTKSNKNDVEYAASITYIGKDSKLHEFLQQQSKQTIAYVSLTIARMESYKYNWIEKEGTRFKRREKTFNEAYDGELNMFYNYASMYDLYQSFPVTKKLKGCSLALLMCCLCDALKTGYITPLSKIVLNASGFIEGHDREESIKQLVRMYERLGFNQLFPDMYETTLEQEYVPMMGTTQTIMNKCNFDTISKELQDVLPIKLCINICK